MPTASVGSATSTVSRWCGSPAAIDAAQLDREPSIFTVVNSSSPLRLDTPMLQGIMEFAAHNQIVCITPFTLAGAMAPVTLAGALAEQNAEALAGMVLTQAVRPGAPVIYGGFTSNVDMQSGAPAFGTPEYMRTAMIGGQLARRYGVPYRSSNVCAANALDAQAAYESVFSLWGAIMGGVNLLMHGAGWMEGGLHASYEKMILDAELLGMVSAFLDPVVVDEDSLAFSAMQEVGPGVTSSGPRTPSPATGPPSTSRCSATGATTRHGRRRARRRCRPRPTGSGRNCWRSMNRRRWTRRSAEELEAFVTRRVAEGGVPTDY